MKGSIYMVFDYMDHDLTGLQEREGHRFTIPQVSHLASVSTDSVRASVLTCPLRFTLSLDCACR